MNQPIDLGMHRSQARRRTLVRGVVLFIVALLVVGVGFTYRTYSRDVNAARARSAAGSQIVETPCGRIEYAVLGEGMPVLVVHGAGGGFDQGLRPARWQLLRHRRRRIAPGRQARGDRRAAQPRLLPGLGRLVRAGLRSEARRELRSRLPDGAGVRPGAAPGRHPLRPP